MDLTRKEFLVLMIGSAAAACGGSSDGPSGNCAANGTAVSIAQNTGHVLLVSKDEVAAAMDPKVSSHHAQFMYEDGQWFVVDTGSTNGTLVDGERITKVRLRQGEEIQIGAGGPMVKVEFDAQDGMGGAMKTEAVSLQDLARYAPRKKISSSPNLADTGQLKAIAKDL